MSSKKPDEATSPPKDDDPPDGYGQKAKPPQKKSEKRTKKKTPRSRDAQDRSRSRSRESTRRGRHFGRRPSPQGRNRTVPKKRQDQLTPALEGAKAKTDEHQTEVRIATGHEQKSETASDAQTGTEIGNLETGEKAENAIVKQANSNPQDAADANARNEIPGTTGASDANNSKTEVATEDVPQDRTGTVVPMVQEDGEAIVTAAESVTQYKTGTDKGDVIEPHVVKTTQDAIQSPGARLPPDTERVPARETQPAGAIPPARETQPPRTVASAETTPPAGTAQPAGKTPPAEAVQPAETVLTAGATLPDGRSPSTGTGAPTGAPPLAGIPSPAGALQPTGTPSPPGAPPPAEPTEGDVWEIRTLNLVCYRSSGLASHQITVKRLSKPPSPPAAATNEQRDPGNLPDATRIEQQDPPDATTGEHRTPETQPGAPENDAGPHSIERDLRSVVRFFLPFNRAPRLRQQDPENPPDATTDEQRIPEDPLVATTNKGLARLIRRTYRHDLRSVVRLFLSLKDLRALRLRWYIEDSDQSPKILEGDGMEERMQGLLNVIKQPSTAEEEYDEGNLIDWVFSLRMEKGDKVLRSQLELVEGWSAQRVIIASSVPLVGSIAMGITWSIVYKDAQTAFTLASFVLALGAALIGLLGVISAWAI